MSQRKAVPVEDPLEAIVGASIQRPVCCRPPAVPIADRLLVYRFRQTSSPVPIGTTSAYHRLVRRFHPDTRSPAAFAAASDVALIRIMAAHAPQ